jgi:hypothetical protein
VKSSSGALSPSYNSMAWQGTRVGGNLSNSRVQCCRTHGLPFRYLNSWTSPRRYHLPTRVAPTSRGGPRVQRASVFPPPRLKANAASPLSDLRASESECQYHIFVLNATDNHHSTQIVGHLPNPTRRLWRDTVKIWGEGILSSKATPVPPNNDCNSFRVRNAEDTRGLDERTPHSIEFRSHSAFSARSS